MYVQSHDCVYWRNYLVTVTDASTQEDLSDLFAGKNDSISRFIVAAVPAFWCKTGRKIATLPFLFTNLLFISVKLHFIISFTVYLTLYNSSLAPHYRNWGSENKHAVHFTTSLQRLWPWIPQQLRFTVLSHNRKEHFLVSAQLFCQNKSCTRPKCWHSSCYYIIIAKYSPLFVLHCSVSLLGCSGTSTVRKRKSQTK